MNTTETEKNARVEDKRSLKRSVVVADDDPELRSLVAEALRADGFSVSEAKDGQELLSMLVDPPKVAVMGRPASLPDLVVTDVQMPGATGLRVLSHLRRAHPTVPVILITAFGSAELHAQAKRLGAATVFDKPFDLNVLRALVRRTLSRS